MVALAVVFGIAGTLFFDNPNVSYSSFILPIIIGIFSMTAPFTASYLCYKHRLYIWSMVAGLPIVLGIIYGICYFPK